MANKKFDPGVNITTPAGTLKFPWLQKPQENPFGKGYIYNCELLLTPEEAAPLIEQLEGLYKQNLQKQAILNNVEKIKGSDTKPWREDVDWKSKEPTGLIAFKFKSPSMRGDYEFKPKLFEANGLPFGYTRNAEGTIEPPTRVPAIGMGTIAKISTNARGYYKNSKAGITLSLEAVQVIKLREAGRNTADAFGFKQEDVPQDDGTQDETDGRF